MVLLVIGIILGAGIVALIVGLKGYRPLEKENRELSTYVEDLKKILGERTDKMMDFKTVIDRQITQMMALQDENEELRRRIKLEMTNRENLGNQTSGSRSLENH